jgi:transcriptional regulator of acetoin/glycerol metabolism
MVVVPVVATHGTGPRPPVARSLRDLEKEGILAALAATNGNKAQAAAILEIDRSTLYKKLKDYDIES